MTTADEETIRKIMGELVGDELKAIHEYLVLHSELLQGLRQDVNVLKQDMTMVKYDISEMKVDIRILRLAAAGASKRLDNHERRITKLERRQANREQYT